MRIKKTTRQEGNFMAWFIQNSNQLIGEPFMHVWHEYVEYCATSGDPNRGIDWMVAMLDRLGVVIRASDGLVAMSHTKACPTCNKPGYSFANIVVNDKNV